MASRSTTRRSWPVLKRYDQDHLQSIALPLGGIGTGTVSLGGRGNLQDVEIMNRPAKGVTSDPAFFALRTKRPGEACVCRVLEGAIPPPYDRRAGCPMPLAGFPRFRKCAFEAAYPFGQVLLSDPDVPLKVTIRAYNPLIPADVENSSIPVAVLRFVLANRTGQRVTASLCGTFKNVIGRTDAEAKTAPNRTRFRQTPGRSGLQGLFMDAPGLPADAESNGTVAFCTTSRTRGVTTRRGWPTRAWGGALLDFWDDVERDGRLEERFEPGDRAPVGSLCVPVAVPPRATREVTFLLTWHFPHRRAWGPARTKGGDKERVGNFYTTRYRDAWDVATRTAARLEDLEARTCAFVRAFCGCDLPDEIKDAAFSNISTLRTETCFRTEDGHFFGFEGSNTGSGCCFGSCTHVWNYEHTSAFLFGALARDMRETEFCRATRSNGMMSGRVQLPLDRAQEYELAHADGQMGCIMRVYREWQLSGDDDFLRRVWPGVRKALKFCWIPGGWDADRDGVMEGCQHNTFDIEFYGPNPMMGAWYLGALRAAERMARYLGEVPFADTCGRLFEQGRDWMDRHLFNGEYYEQDIRPAESVSRIAPGLRNVRYGPGGGPGGPLDLQRPEMQQGRGCQSDQLAGQTMAYVCGLGRLLKPAHIRKTFASIMKYNFKKHLFGHMCHRRAFAVNGEAGLVVCTYPGGGRPAVPFPYINEIWNGLEYTLAASLLFEGRRKQALDCVRAVRDRHDGRKRNPFDEPECGHHYVRSMAAWAAVPAWTGFRYSGVTRTMHLGQTSGRWFWSTGNAWGTVSVAVAKRGMSVRLKVLGGALDLETFVLKGYGEKCFTSCRHLEAGQTERFTMPRRGSRH